MIEIGDFLENRVKTVLIKLLRDINLLSFTTFSIFIRILKQNKVLIKSKKEELADKIKELSRSSEITKDDQYIRHMKYEYHQLSEQLHSFKDILVRNKYEFINSAYKCSLSCNRQCSAKM